VSYDEGVGAEETYEQVDLAGGKVSGMKGAPLEDGSRAPVDVVCREGLAETGIITTLGIFLADL
jgi:hypothetical protein